MGVHEEQKELFSYEVDLDKRVRADNPLRKIKERVDFDWVRDEVKELYGSNGHESLDPVIIVKLMLLLYLDNVRSERELMRILAERLDYLWFLGYGLDDAVPNHSVLSKARRRWGESVFEKLFIYTVKACVEAGLVEGRTLHADGSLIDADASKDSVVNGPEVLIDQLKVAYQSEQVKLTEGNLGQPYYKSKNREFVSTTDPDAPCIRQSKTGGKGDSRPRYKHHRAVDDAHGVIVAAETTSGHIEENEKLESIVEQADQQCGKQYENIVGDKQYGTVDNFRKLKEKGYTTHMDYGNQGKHHDRRGLFTLEEFIYDPGSNTYQCPSGQALYPRRRCPRRQATEYHLRKGTCNQCALRDQCTQSKTGRTILRHDKQELVDAGKNESRSREARRNRIRRRIMIEGSFGQATRHHFKRSRYRRLWRQKIQDAIICAIQNLKILISNEVNRPKTAQSTCIRVYMRVMRSYMRPYRFDRVIFSPCLFSLAPLSIIGGGARKALKLRFGQQPLYV